MRHCLRHNLAFSNSLNVSPQVFARNPKSPQLTPVRMPGEFERQKAILLSVSDWMPHHFPVLTQIAEKTAGRVNVLILYNDLKQLTPVVIALAQSGKPHTHLYFCPMKLNTIWLRDLGRGLARRQTDRSHWISFMKEPDLWMISCLPSGPANRRRL